MCSPRLCTPELFNQGWTREGALEMLTWIKYDRTPLLHSSRPPPPTLSSLPKPCWLLDYLVAEFALMQTDTGAFGGKKGLEVITSLAIRSLTIKQEERISIKLLKDSLWEVWINSRFSIRKLFVKLKRWTKAVLSSALKLSKRRPSKIAWPRSMGVVWLNVRLNIKDDYLKL